jgi:DNA-binding beta-propeller fold protein YncE
MSNRDMNIPLALAYDPVGKHLFVADGGNNRVLVFDADPKRLKTYDAAIAVIGQTDFTSRRRDTGVSGVNLGVAFGRGITSTAPLPMGFAIDQKRQRLFLSDGGNNRILVYDIGSGKIRTGMAATEVIGQPDFKTNLARADAGGFNVPSDLAYDPDHDRLFAVDGMNSRVLVFKASPADIKAGPKAGVVLGQGDFTSTKWVRLDSAQVSEDVGRRQMRMPSGIAYDRVRQQLYVNDKGNDRVLIFDAAPGKLDSGAPATGVIGQPDFVTRIAGDGEQEQLLDPRQLAFDSENQRLYVADSFWGRLMMFDIPRSERKVALETRSMRTYGTIDAWNNRTQPEDPRWGKPQPDRQQAWRASLTGAGALPGATLVYHRTRQVLEPKSLRRYRILISETSLSAPKPSRSALFAVNKDERNESRIVVSNPSAGTARVQFRLKSGSKSLDANRTLAPGAQLDLTLTDLFAGDAHGSGTLRVSSDVDVGSFALQQVTTSRGENLVVAGLGGATPEAGEAFVIPHLQWGGGYESEIVLLNPHTTALEGRLAFYDSDGRALNSQGGGVQPVSFKIEPDGMFRHAIRSPSVWPTEAYAVVEAAGHAPPSGGAAVRVWKDSLLLTEQAIPVRPVTHLAWAPVDTEPSLIRHGRSQMSFTVANPTGTPALLRFTLFDSEGKERGRYEQVLPPNLQHSWTLGDLFNLQTFRGSVRLWSDVAVGLAVERTTRSMRGEPVGDHISYLTPQGLQGAGSMEIPQILDGEGMATEIMLINLAESPSEARWTFSSPEGKAKEIILR